MHDYVREARKRKEGENVSESAARKRCHAAAGELHFSIQQQGESLENMCLLQ